MAGPGFNLSPCGAGGVLPFGFVAAGDSYSYYLPIYNNGSTPLIITAVSITAASGTPGADFVVSNFTGPITIAPGGKNQTLQVSFTPTAAAETAESATLQFTSNAISGLQTFTLKGTCVNAGSSTTYAASPTGETISADQNGSGNTTQTSGSQTYGSNVIPAGNLITFKMNVQATSSLSGSGGGTVYFQYSLDGGTTWTTLFQWSWTSSTSLPAQNQSTSFVAGISSTSTVRTRVQVSASAGPASQSIGTGTINSAEIIIGTPSDVYCRLVQYDSTDGSSTNQIPPVLNFGSVVLGSTYLSNQIAVVNTNLNAQSVTLAADGASGYTLENQSGSNPIAPGDKITLNLQLVPTTAGSQDDPTALTVTIASQVGAIDMEALYVAAAINPIYTLNDSVEAMLLAFNNVQGQVNVLQADPTDLTCEEDAFALRQYQLGDPWTVQELSRLLMRYERYGPTVVTVTYSSLLGPYSGQTPAQEPVVTQRTFDSATDQLLKSTLFDGAIAGDIISIQIDVAANSGPFSMTLFAPYVEPRGEDIEAT